MKEGTLTAPEHTKSDNPRELVTWERLVTISVYASDESDISNEELQLEASTTLLETTLGSIYNAFTPGLSASGTNRELGFTGQASLAWGGPVTRIQPPVEFPHGTELLVTFTQKGPLFDVLQDTVTPTVIVLAKSFQNPPSPSPPFPPFPQ
jgi:hypothetical protein